MGATFRFDGTANNTTSVYSEDDGPPFAYNGGCGQYSSAKSVVSSENERGSRNTPEAILRPTMDLGKGWKDAEMRQHLDDLEDEIHGLRWMHEQSARYYGRRMKWLTYPLNILPALSGVGSITLQSQEESQQPMLLTIGILSFLILFLNKLVSTSPWPSLYRNHRITAQEYRKILRNIHREKLKHTRKRVALQDLEGYVVNRKDQLTPMSLEIPAQIERHYVKTMSGHMVLPDTILPDLVDGNIAGDIRSFHHRYRPDAQSNGAAAGEKVGLWRAMGKSLRAQANVPYFHTIFMQRAQEYNSTHLLSLPCLTKI